MVYCKIITVNLILIIVSVLYYGFFLSLSSNTFLWHIGYNHFRLLYPVLVVVIWLHSTIFDILDTTRNSQKMLPSQLWFGYILLSLTYWIQQNSLPVIPCRSCDLVTFYYLWHIGYNTEILFMTTRMLWFGYILLSLTYWIQPAITL